jgi:hypothetical protein
MPQLNLQRVGWLGICFHPLVVTRFPVMLTCYRSDSTLIDYQNIEATWSNLLGSRLGVVKMEKLFDTSNLQSVSNPLAHSYKRKAAAILLMVDVCTDQGSYSGGVDVRHASEIQDELARRVAAY